MPFAGRNPNEPVIPNPGLMNANEAGFPPRVTQAKANVPFRIQSPVKGVVRSVGREEQPEGSCFDALNIWPFDRQGLRRASVRSGLSQAFTVDLSLSTGQPITALAQASVVPGTTWGFTSTSTTFLNENWAYTGPGFLPLFSDGTSSPSTGPGASGSVPTWVPGSYTGLNSTGVFQVATSHLDATGHTGNYGGAATYTGFGGLAQINSGVFISVPITFTDVSKTSQLLIDLGRTSGIPGPNNGDFGGPEISWTPAGVVFNYGTQAAAHSQYLSGPLASATLKIGFQTGSNGQSVMAFQFNNGPWIPSQSPQGFSRLSIGYYGQNSDAATIGNITIGGASPSTGANAAIPAVWDGVGSDLPDAGYAGGQGRVTYAIAICNGLPWVGQYTLAGTDIFPAAPAPSTVTSWGPILASTTWGSTITSTNFSTYFPSTYGTFASTFPAQSTVAPNAWQGIAIFNPWAYIVDGTSTISQLNIPGDYLSTYVPDYILNVNSTTGVPSTALVINQPPTNCILAANWRGRLVLAGDLNNPQNFYMSRLGDPYDWNYSALAIGDTASAFAGNLSNAGQIGQSITALMPFTDDLMMIGCTHSVWLMNGDPAAGGSISLVTDEVGVVGPRAWCKDPYGFLYFVGTGGLYRVRPPWEFYMPPENLTEKTYDQYFKTLDAGASITSMVYDADTHYIHIYNTPLDQSAGIHLTFDTRNGGLWPVSFAPFCGPTTAINYLGDASPETRAIFVGGWDGYVRRLDDNAYDDDGEYISASLTLGPIKVVPDDAILAGVTPVLGESGQGAPIARGIAGVTEYGALNNPQIAGNGWNDFAYSLPTNGGLGLPIQGSALMQIKAPSTSGSFSTANPAGYRYMYQANGFDPSYVIGYTVFDAPSTGVSTSLAAICASTAMYTSNGAPLTAQSNWETLQGNFDLTNTTFTLAHAPLTTFRTEPLTFSPSTGVLIVDSPSTLNLYVPTYGFTTWHTPQPQWSTQSSSTIPISTVPQMLRSTLANSTWFDANANTRFGFGFPIISTGSPPIVYYNNSPQHQGGDASTANAYGTWLSAVDLIVCGLDGFGGSTYLYPTIDFDLAGNSLNFYTPPGSAFASVVVPIYTYMLSAQADSPGVGSNWNVNVTVNSGPDAYSVTDGTPHGTYTVQCPLERRQKTFRQRIRGSWYSMQLSNSIDNCYFSFESAVFEFRQGGRTRNRR